MNLKDKFYKILDQRLIDFYHEIEKKKETCPDMIIQEELEKAWEGYLRGLGVKTGIGRDVVERGSITLQDPLYTNMTWLLVPVEFAEKALVLGSLP
jgi:hypothetical protein